MDSGRDGSLQRPYWSVRSVVNSKLGPRGHRVGLSQQFHTFFDLATPSGQPGHRPLV
jgi:murein DD-endopeptidase MepM/ murein hydrolase activator NlpD